jgi:hypothetical protein
LCLLCRRSSAQPLHPVDWEYSRKGKNLKWIGTQNTTDSVFMLFFLFLKLYGIDHVLNLPWSMVSLLIIIFWMIEMISVVGQGVIFIATAICRKLLKPQLFPFQNVDKSHSSL